MRTADNAFSDMTPPSPRFGAIADPALWGALLAIVFASPIVALMVLAASGDAAYISHIASTRLAEFARNSAAVALLAGLGAATIGTACAWIVTRFEFTGRRVLSWLLILPLAMPGYVAAYSWYALTAAGSRFEALIGINIPTVTGLTGAVMVFAFTLYPYVYLLARNSFEAHGRLSWDVARSLGAGPWRAFSKVALPLTWPAIAAGTALVGMEVLADYGVADFLGVTTLTVGIVRAWSSFSDPAAAAQLAVMLLFAALLLLGAERGARGRRQFSTSGQADVRPVLVELSGLPAFLAVLVCALPVAIGIVIPTAQLVWLAIETQPARSILPAIQGTAFLSFWSGILAILLGLTAAYALRRRNRIGTAAVRIVQAGYAIPGAVAAIAILSALALLQSGLSQLGGSAIPILTGGSILALLLAYQTRFAAVAILPCETALLKVRGDLDEAARSLGERPRGVVKRVHVPLTASGIATAGVLVAIEVMKELPATMILRPFDLQTLAVAAHNYASDERLAQAALPALVLLAICMPATAALNLLGGRK